MSLPQVKAGRKIASGSEPKGFAWTLLSILGRTILHARATFQAESSLDQQVMPDARHNRAKDPVSNALIAWMAHNVTERASARCQECPSAVLFWEALQRKTRRTILRLVSKHRQVVATSFLEVALISRDRSRMPCRKTSEHVISPSICLDFSTNKRTHTDRMLRPLSLGNCNAEVPAGAKHQLSKRSNNDTSPINCQESSATRRQPHMRLQPATTSSSTCHPAAHEPCLQCPLPSELKQQIVQVSKVDSPNQSASMRQGNKHRGLRAQPPLSTANPEASIRGRRRTTHLKTAWYTIFDERIDILMVSTLKPSEGKGPV